MIEGYAIRKYVSHVEEIVHEGGQPPADALVKAAVGVVIANPFAGRYGDDLAALIAPSAALGAELGRRAVALLGGRPVAGYGKGGMAGVDGEQEHVVACITTVFGDAFRAAVGGGEAWISSASKTVSAGAALDIPLAHKDALYVRSHYDTITVSFPDAPAPDEVVVIFAVASRGRINARLGGLRAEDVKGQDGLT
jgi:Amino acid synthesis